MTRIRIAAVVALIAFAACSRITVITGAPPSNKQIDLPWQKYWVFGIIDPPAISTKEECPLGIARFQTEQSFLNGLVNSLTFHIYTPIHTTITCASGPVVHDR